MGAIISKMEANCLALKKKFKNKKKIKKKLKINKRKRKVKKNKKLATF